MNAASASVLVMESISQVGPPLRPQSDHNRADARWREGGPGSVATSSVDPECSGAPLLRAVGLRAPCFNPLRNVAKRRTHGPCPNRKGAMRPLTNWPLFPLVMTGALPTEGSPAARVSDRAGSPRRADRGARLFPVRHQAQHGQGFHERRLRAEADGGDGRSGESREMAPRADGDRHVACVSGRRHCAAGGWRRHGDPFQFGRRRRSRRAPHQYRQFGRTGGPRQRPRAADERRRDSGAPKDALGEGQHRRNRPSMQRLRRATRPPRPSSARRPSSRRRRSRRPSPAGSACATSISGNTSRWGRAS